MSGQFKTDKEFSALRAITSLVAVVFLAWTLASPTFLDTSSAIVRTSLHHLSLLSSRAEAKINSMSLQIMR
jgi:hypothetical protein